MTNEQLEGIVAAWIHWHSNLVESIYHDGNATTREKDWAIDLVNATIPDEAMFLPGEGEE